jgi:hypothetical protein
LEVRVQAKRIKKKQKEKEKKKENEIKKGIHFSSWKISLDMDGKSIAS